MRVGVHGRTVPSAVTIVSERRLSQVRPSLREAKPTPPPSARPAMPTVGHEPAGIVTPCCASLAYTSSSRAPAPTLALPRARSKTTPSRRETSITTPLVVE